MIALLAARPLRMRNFTKMRIGQHLVRQGGLYHVVFERHETKTGWSIDLPLPAQLTSYIFRYLAHHRPLLLGSLITGKRSRTEIIPARDALWISENGAAMSVRGIGQQIEFATRSEYGVTINPHLFRDCAVTSFSIEDPNQIQATAAVLGVRNLRVVEESYNHAPPESAIQRYFDALKAIREELERGCSVTRSRRRSEHGSLRSGKGSPLTARKAV